MSDSQTLLSLSDPSTMFKVAAVCRLPLAHLRKACLSDTCQIVRHFFTLVSLSDPCTVAKVAAGCFWKLLGELLLSHSDQMSKPFSVSQSVRQSVSQMVSQMVSQVVVPFQVIIDNLDVLECSDRKLSDLYRLSDLLTADRD